MKSKGHTREDEKGCDERRISIQQIERFAEYSFGTPDPTVGSCQLLDVGCSMHLDHVRAIDAYF